MEWIRGCLTRTADDKDEEEEESEESVAIVPLTEAQENAMESTVFKALLKRCGIKPPANEQVGSSRVLR